MLFACPVVSKEFFVLLVSYLFTFFSDCSCSYRFPFRIPKLYFADINRDTTNYVLIVERIPFGKRGKIVNGKVEKVPRKPFEILPVCGKYQDSRHVHSS